MGYTESFASALQIEVLEEAGFTIVHVKDLLDQFEKEEITPDELQDTLILIPSAELSRARGGFHCMSMPLFREDID